MMNMDENEINFEKSLYNVMLSLMMLYERGCLSKMRLLRGYVKLYQITSGLETKTTQVLQETKLNGHKQ